MGLEMYAFKTRENITNCGFDHPSDCEEIYYWRKHPNLHGWMYELFLKKISNSMLEGNENNDISGDGIVCINGNLSIVTANIPNGGYRFNSETLKLTLDDLDQLEKDVMENALPETTGFFFGVSSPEDKDDDLKFIRIARECIEEGYNVFYDSWW